MKNLLISTVLGIFICSCAKSNYANLDSQFANSSKHSISAKYNNKNCIDSDKHKEQIVRQIAIATQE